MTLSVTALTVILAMTLIVAGTAPYAGEPGHAAVSHPEPYLSAATISALTGWIDGSDTISESFSVLPGWALADDTGIQEKFEPGLYQKIQNLVASQPRQESSTRSAVPPTYYDIVILVATHDADGNDISKTSKKAVSNLLTEAGARNVSAAQTLSFVTASVPVAAINSVSLYGEVFLIGDGQRELVHAMSVARQTVNATGASLGRTNGTGVTVAVLDDGINHPSLNDKTTHVKCTPSCTVVIDLAGINSSNNQVTHGTLVAHAAAGSKGIAPGASLLDIDLLGGGNLAFYHALDWAITGGADAVNYSIVHLQSKKSTCNLSGLISHHVANDAINRGMFIVGVAGNNAVINGTTTYKSVQNPGCATGVLTVGGIDDRGVDLRMFNGSGRGPVFDDNAINANAPLLKPEIVAPAVKLIIPVHFIVENDSGSTVTSGTSLAAPMATGAAAVLLEEDGELDARELRAALLVGADWKGPVPCTSVQFETSNASDNCSHARQPTDQNEANGPGSLGILNNVGFGVLNVGQSLDYVRNGEHIVSGNLGAGHDRTYFLKVDDPDKPLKVILSWNSPTEVIFNDNRTSFTGASITLLDTGMKVACPGMDTVVADSVRQVNEFAVFTPARAGTCTVTVTDVDYAAGYALASTGSFVDEGAFITTWRTGTAGKMITIPLVGNDITVDWGDGDTSTGVSGPVSHTYDDAGDHTVSVSGGLDRINLNNTGVASKLVSIDQWGDTQWTSMENAFNGASNMMMYKAIDAPDLSGAQDMSGMFEESSFNGDISSWNVSSVTDMSLMFVNASNFNGNIGSWNVSQVTDMNHMFDGATSFNQTLNGWDVSSVTVMRDMFRDVTSFNRPLNTWNVSQVTNMSSMFDGATDFNQSINDWDVSSATVMFRMFNGAISFNQPLNDWNVSQVTNMTGMFNGATDFNRPLNSWNVSGVKEMTHMFRDATSFGQNLGEWYVVLNDTAISGATETLTIRAQNGVLDGQNPIYALSSGRDTYMFEISGSTLGLKPSTDYSAKTSYMVNVTSTGSFGTNNWRMVDVTVTDIDSTPPTFVSSGLDIATWMLSITFSEPIDLTSVDPAKIHVRESGSYTGGITLTDDELGTIADGEVISFTLTPLHRAAVAVLNAPELTIEPGAVRDASRNAIVGTFDISTASFTGTSVSISDRSPSDMEFSNDGTKMFVVGDTGNNIKEYTLSTPFDLSTASSAGSTSISSQDTSPTGMAFSNDGAKMFVVGFGSSRINEYTLSAPFDVSTRTFVDAFSVSGQESYPSGMAFSNDGTKVFVIGPVRDKVVEYTLSDAFDVSTASFANVDFSIKPQETAPSGMAFSNDGAKMFVVGTASKNVNEYTLSTPFDVSTASFANVNFSVSSQDINPSGMAFSNDGAKMFVVGFGADRVFQYTLRSVYPITVTAPVVPAEVFVTTWKTTTANESITIPATGTYTIDWGDGASDEDVTDTKEHMYAFAGNHTVIITGGLERIRLGDDGTDASKLISIDQWGSIQWTSMAFAFAGASDMRYEATDAPDLSGVTDMSGMFSDTELFNGDLANWDVSQVTDMNSMFTKTAGFNGDISSWNVSQVTDMNGMFSGAELFNSDISSWNVSKVINMSEMFSEAFVFDQSLNGWDVSSVTDMSSMFLATESFNGNISSWNVSAVTDMSEMFEEATSFDQNLGNWYVVANATSIERDDVPGVVAELSAQNSRLDDHSINYGMGAGGDWAYFEITGDDSDLLNMTSAAAEGTYYVNVTAWGAGVFSNGNNWRVLTIAVIGQANAAPNVIAGPGQTVGEGDTVTLSGSATDTDEGDTVESYSWSAPLGSEIAFANSSLASTTFTAPDVTMDTPFTITLTAFDGTGYGEAQIVVTVKETSGAFITTWRTTIANEQITLPLVGTGITVVWGDGSTDTGVSGSVTHPYAATGNHTVSITGGLDRINLNNGASAPKLISIDWWGDTQWTSMENAFYGARNMTYMAADAPDLSGVTTMSNMFNTASAFNGNISDWDVSGVTLMNGMFSDASAFNGNISGWNVSQVTDMSNMFFYATSFNQHLNDWNVSQVTDMGGIFHDALVFNGNVSSWNVSQVTDTSYMFFAASAFNGDISGWDVSQVTSMLRMFFGASDFNGNISGWNVLQVTDMLEMFSGATSFDRPLNNWNVSSVTLMNSMFSGATSFNQTLNDWNVSSVIHMDHMFHNATSFNQTLNNWNVSSVTTMNSMFSYASNFNGNISGWNVLQVTHMSSMFNYADAFNQNLDSWNTSHVSDMSGMFFGASDFNGNISGWNVSSVTLMNKMFTGASNFNGAISSWDVSSVLGMSQMFDGATLFRQNLGEWYIVPADTAYDATTNTLNVTTISTQNFNLEGHSPAYAIGAGGNFALFNMTGSTLMFKTTPSAVDYTVNVTAPGGDFGTGNHRILNVTVTGSANAPPTVSAGSNLTVAEGGTLALSGSATGTDGDAITSYMWSAPPGSGITFVNASLPTTTFTAPSVNADITYTLTLTAGDGTGHGTGTIDVTVKETSGAFITTWQTIGSNQTVTIPVNPNFDYYNYTIIWGDGSSDTEVDGNTDFHTYDVANNYKVLIYGTYPGIYIGAYNYGNAENLVSIDQWGSNRWASMESAFAGASDMTYNATDAPDLSGVSDMSNMFSGAGTFNQSLNNWNVSSVTLMNSMFSGAEAFDGDISDWNVSSVTDMSEMFSGAGAFNQPLNNWNVSSVTNMSVMFDKASVFNQPLNNWNVSQVTDMSNMFSGAEVFDGDISDWNVSSVINMYEMFAGAEDFDGDISDWNVSSVTDMEYMFEDAASFMQNLGKWYVVPADTVYDVTTNTLNVTTISAQNSNLKGHTPNYAIGAGGNFALFNMTGSTLMFKTTPSAVDYTVNVTAPGGDFGTGNHRILNVTVTGSANAPPTVSAGSNLTVAEGGTLALSGSATGTDGDAITSYMWSAPPGSGITFVNASLPTTTFTAPSVNADTTYTLTLTAGDGTGHGTGTIDVTVKETSGAFITTWQTIGSNQTVTIPVNPNFDYYNYTIIWGDGSSDTEVDGNTDFHTYDVANNYKVLIYGTYPGIYIGANNYGNAENLVSIDQWGSNRWASMESAFAGASDMTYNATDAPDLSGVSDMSNMFSGAGTFNQSLNNWNVSSVTLMNSMFSGAEAFDGDISDWNVSSVTDMSEMFSGAGAFNQPLNNWNVSSVTNMSVMFDKASVFNQPLNNWNVSQVTDMSNMFSGAEVFDGDISDWNVSSVINMYEMFAGAEDFDGDISDWNVSSVTDMEYMFEDAASFMQNLGKWYVVPADTVYDVTTNTLNVTTISAQNSNLKGHTPNYAIGAGGNFALFNMTGSTLMFKTTPSAVDYTVNVTAPGGDFGTGNHRILNVTVTGSANAPPTVSAGSNLTVAEGGTLALSGSATGTDGDAITSYMWSAPPGSGITFANASLPDTTFTAPSVNADTPYTLTLTAGDGTGHGTDTIDVTVKETSGAFITTWQTTGNNQDVTIPANPRFASNYTIIWGDGSSDTGVLGYADHTYDVANNYKVLIYGTYPGIYIGANNYGNAENLVSIDQWGSNRWASMESAFAGASDMTYNATDAPDLSGVSDMSNMFSGAGTFNQSLNNWNVSSVTLMNSMFSGAEAFDGDISDWNVSSVTDMSEMFSGAGAFNQPLNNWNVSSVTNMSVMFDKASVFNQPLNNWNVSQVTDMSNMFSGAEAFDGDISDWNVSSVINMYEMFAGAEDFDGDISDWNVSSVTDMEYMFEDAASFMQNLGKWYVVPADTVYDVTTNTLNVTTISAQNSVLDVPSPNYAIGAGGNSTLFNMTGSTLMFKTTPSAVDYTVNVTAPGGDFGTGNHRILNVTVTGSANTPPTVSAGSNLTVAEGGTLALSGSATDTDGDAITSYMWSAPPGSGITFANASLPDTTFTAPSVNADTPYTLTLTAGDGTGHGTDTIDVTVKETSGAFITTWRTTIANEQITLPLVGTGITVVWGDGSTDTGVSGSVTHPYAATGNHTVSITGGLDRINLNNGASAPKLISIDWWGDTQWTSMENAFYGARNMTYMAADAPDLSGVTTMSNMFNTASAFNGNISDWDVSGVTLMNGMFSDASAFNGNISGWNVSQVTDMSNMFFYATSFNQHLNDWNVSQVTDMGGIFHDALVFNGNVSSWNVSQVTDTSYMFFAASAFNGDISGWDVSQVTSMLRMFFGASDFNGNISGWNVLQVTDMLEMFSGATSFDRPLNNWNVSSVTLMNSMFSGATSFNQTLNDWNVSSVIHMDHMFHNATSFNQTLNNWNVSSVTTMNSMFSYASNFNGNISGWNVLQVTHMSSMFNYADAFNQNLDSWNTSHVSDMSGMFFGASDFNGNISGWNVSSVTLMNKMFTGASNFNGAISSWDVSSVLGMSQMFDGATLFRQNLGEWYIVPADTAYDATTNTLNVTTISTQNFNLEGHSPAYAIGAGGNFALFNMTGSTLMFKTTPSAVDYTVNVTAPGGDFGTGNHRILNVTVTGSANAPPTVSAGSNLTVAEGGTLALSGSATGTDGDAITSYMWSAPPGSGITFVNASLPTTTFTAPSVNADITYTLTLTAGDGTGHGTGTIDVTVKETSGAFITTWQTIGSNQTVTIPVNPNFDYYNYTIIWGDGSSDTEVDGNTDFHTYDVANNYKVLIYGTYPGIYIGANNYGNAENLVSIDQWGSNRWASMESAFAGASDMTYNATDAPDLSGVSDMSNMFSGAGTFNQSLNNWNVSSVTLMNSMFSGAEAFDGDISDWNVSSVTDMSEMFSGAGAFNQPLNNWNVSSVTNMSVMFDKASVFNQPLNNWNVSQVTDMSNMFSGAEVFDGDISDWNVSSVINMYEMFAGAEDFDGDISDWNVSSVTDMEYMFEDAASFMQNLGKWYVVPADTVYDVTTNTLNVTTISAQNSNLKGHTPNYAIGAGGNFALFNMTGSTLMFKTTPSAVDYTVNVTAPGGDFGTGNHRILNVTVTGSANAPPTVSAGSNLTVAEGGTLALSGSATGTDGDAITSYMWSAPLGSGITFANASLPTTTFTAPSVNADTTYTLTLTAGDGTGHGTDTIDVTVKETSGAFITTWRTTTVGDSITIPVGGAAGTYNVIWGDGTAFTGLTGNQTHRYAVPGDHTVAISGGFERIYLRDDTTNASKLRSIDQWGSTGWTSMKSAFDGASAMTYGATDVPDLSRVTDMSDMLYGTVAFNGNISGWDVSGVTDMKYMFFGSNFNQPLNNWNVSGVTDMNTMFRNAGAFNGNISDWDVSSVTDMNTMFRNAGAFNQNISGWNVSGVTNMASMFRNADVFNQPLNNWNVSGVTDMSYMFESTGAFNGNISDWDVSEVTNMERMFRNAGAFNQSIGSWNVSSVTGMTDMFVGATSFQQNLGEWYVVLDDTAITGATETLVIRAQNPTLNGQTLTYSLGEDGDSGLFVISGRTLGLNSTVDYSGKTQYSVNITSTGGFGTGNHRMTDITVTDANRNPVLASINPKTATEHVELSFNVTATDADDNSVTFSLGGTLLAGTTITPDGVFTWTPVEDQDGVHTVTVLAADSRGGTHELDVIITVSEVNEAPTADAGLYGPYGEGVSVTLDGATASDPDTIDGNPDPLMYLWVQTGGTSVEGLAGTNTTSPSFTTPTVYAGQYAVFNLTVTDAGSLRDVDTVTIRINNDVNEPPVADAGDASTVDESTANVPLDGTGSSDHNISDGDTLTYMWSQTDGTHNVTLSGSDMATASFNAPVVASTTELMFMLNVTDARGGSDTDSVTITVRNSTSNAPHANAGGNRNVTEDIPVTLNGTASSDPNGDILTYSWNQTRGPDVALSNGTAPTTSFVSPVVKAPTLLTFELTVDDGSEQDAASVTITVLDNESDDPVAAVDAPTEADEGMMVTLDGAASSDPNGDQMTYLWVQASGQTLVTLSAPTGNVTTFAAPTVTAQMDLDFTLTVRDVDKNFDAADFTVIIRNSINEPPGADAGTNRPADEGETVQLDGSGSSDPNGDQLTYLWVQTGGPDVTLSGDDDVRAEFVAPQVKSPQGLVFELTVTDTHGDEGGPDRVTVTVQNSHSDLPVAVAGNDRSVGEGAPVTLDGSDSYDPNGDTLTYLWSQTAGSDVQLSNATAAVATFTSPDVQGDGVLEFALTVTDVDGLHTDTVSITVQHTGTGTPFARPGDSRSVGEGDAVTLDGLNSYDPDGNDITHEWTQISGSPVTLLGAYTAVASFDAPRVPDDERLVFELTVDDGITEDSARITITVLDDRNDPPVLQAIPAQSKDELDTVKFSAEATDADGNDLRFALTGQVPRGASMTRDGLFSWTPDQSQDGLYSFNVTVSDGDGGTDSEPVEVTINDIAPRPVLARSAGSSIVLMLSETVTSSTDGPNGFSVNSQNPVAVKSVSGNGSNSLMLLLNGTIQAGSALSYDQNVGDVADETGKALEPFDDLAISFQSKSRSSASSPAITIGSQGHPVTLGTTPSGPLWPVPADDTSIFPLVIDGNGYALHSDTVTVIPTGVTAGRPVTITVAVYDPLPILYFGIYLHLPGDTISHMQSDVQVAYDSGKIRVTDPGGLLRDISMILSEDPDDPARKAVTLTVTFTESIGDTNMVMRTWNTDRQSTEVRIFDALAVQSPDAADPEPDAADPEPDAADPEPVAVVPDTADSEPITYSDTAEHQMLVIRMWSGFEPESLTDDQLLHELGLDYLEADIPDWMMTELGVLVAKGDVTADEFLTSLVWMLDNL